MLPDSQASPLLSMDFGPFSTRPRRSCSSTRAPEKLLGLGREGRTWSYRTTGPPVRPSCRFALASWTSSGLAGASGGTSNSRSSPQRRSLTFSNFSISWRTNFRLTQLLSDFFSNSSICFSQLLFVPVSHQLVLVSFLSFPSLRSYAREFLHTDPDSAAKSLPDTSMGPRAAFHWEAPGLSLTLHIVFILICEHGFSDSNIQKAVRKIYAPICFSLSRILSIRLPSPSDETKH